MQSVYPGKYIILRSLSCFDIAPTYPSNTWHCGRRRPQTPPTKLCIFWQISKLTTHIRRHVQLLMFSCYNVESSDSRHWQAYRAARDYCFAEEVMCDWFMHTRVMLHWISCFVHSAGTEVTAACQYFIKMLLKSYEWTCACITYMSVCVCVCACGCMYISIEPI